MLDKNPTLSVAAAGRAAAAEIILQNSAVPIPFPAGGVSVLPGRGATNASAGPQLDCRSQRQRISDGQRRARRHALKQGIS
jgi:hypothetical protein